MAFMQSASAIATPPVVVRRSPPRVMLWYDAAAPLASPAKAAAMPVDSPNTVASTTMRTESLTPPVSTPNLLGPLAPPSQAKDTPARTVGYHGFSRARARAMSTEPVSRCARYRPGILAG